MNKYHNKKTTCLSRHRHDSKFEANYCNRLLAMQQRGEIKSYKIQHSFDLKIKDELICRHVVDFLVFNNRYLEGAIVLPGDIEAHEAKGFRTDVWEIKRKLFKAVYPTIPYIVISKKDSTWTKRASSSHNRKVKSLLSRLRKSA